MEVAIIFTSGLKIEVLGGRGRDRVLEKPRPPLFLFSDVAVFGDSSCMSFIIDGLGDLLGGPRMVGASDMRTQFCRRWPLRAVGLPFKADGFPDDNGAGSH